MGYPLFEGRSLIIKDIHKLEFDEEITALISKMIQQIEYPVIFWINAETDKNYVNTHGRNPNQYWITIKAGTSKEETERIIVGNLYKIIQVQRRYSIIMPKMQYLERIQNEPDRQRRFEFELSEMNVLCRTFESEMFAEYNGLKTAEAVKETKYRYYQNGLKQYIEMQRQQPGYSWLQENEASNLIGFASCAIYKPEYSAWFKNHLMQVKPTHKAIWYCGILRSIEILITKAKESYNGDNGEEIVLDLQRKIIELFHLESIAEIGYDNVYTTVSTIQGEEKTIFSFIPDGFDNKIIVLAGMRAANECLGLIREISYLNPSLPNVKVVVSYDSGNNMSSFVSTKGHQYYVLIYVDFLLNLKRIIEKNELSGAMAVVVLKKGLEYVQTRLFRYVLFYITLHEYGHIIHGDCDELVEEPALRPQKEKQADLFADQNIQAIIADQYRQIEYEEHLELMSEDKAFLAEVKNIVNQIRRMNREF